MSNVSQKAVSNGSNIRKEITKGTIICLFFVLGLLSYFSIVMGIGPAFSVIMKTSHDLLLNTCFYIMAVAVLAGAVSSVFSEFGVISLINRAISPLMRPLFKLPGASALGAVSCFFSDNPAIVVNAKDPTYAKYFKKYEWATMLNFGTTFGMGIIITTGILGVEAGAYAPSVALGVICAFIGGIISNRLLMRKTKKVYGTEATVGPEYLDTTLDVSDVPAGYRKVREGTSFQRGLNATFDGGRAGVQLWLSIIPGILVFTTFVMMLTNGPSVVDGVKMYVGAAYEGTGLLTWLGDKLTFVLSPLFGLAQTEVLGPILTSLGACGASIAGAKQLAEAGLMSGHDMSVYFAISYCWAGFISSHASMADAMNVRSIVTYAMLVHFIGGLVAGIIANYGYLLLSMVF